MIFRLFTRRVSSLQACCFYLNLRPAAARAVLTAHHAPIPRNSKGTFP